MKNELEDPQPAVSLEFSGAEETYDNGLFRITLPAELIAEDVDSDLRFRVDGLPFQIDWTTTILEKPALEQMNCPLETVEDIIRFFLPDLSPQDPMRPIFLANGFYMGSQSCFRGGECRNSCVLVALADEDTLVMASLELTAPGRWKDDMRLFGLLHLLRKSVRSALCSIGESKVNTSRDWLNVEKIGICFPEMLGGMTYRLAVDYRPVDEGKGISLRYTDDDGRRADIYIYDNGDDYIEPGAETEDVAREMRSTTTEIFTVYQSSELSMLRDTITNYGEDLRFADVRYYIPPELTTDGGAFVTATHITAYRGAFIKVRFTPMSGEIQQQHPLLDRFMNDLADLLAA